MIRRPGMLRLIIGRLLAGLTTRPPPLPLPAAELLALTGAVATARPAKILSKR